jgi:serine/threonine protein kinase
VECFTGKPAFESNDLDVWQFTDALKKYKPNMKGASEEFVDFVSQCLTFDFKKRPNASELLGHPFIKKSQKDKNGEEIVRTETLKFIQGPYDKKKRQSQEERPRGSSTGIHVHTSTLNQNVDDLLKEMK